MTDHILNFLYDHPEVMGATALNVHVEVSSGDLMSLVRQGMIDSDVRLTAKGRTHVETLRSNSVMNEDGLMILEPLPFDGGTVVKGGWGGDRDLPVMDVDEKTYDHQYRLPDGSLLTIRTGNYGTCHKVMVLKC